MTATIIKFQSADGHHKAAPPAYRAPMFLPSLKRRRVSSIAASFALPVLGAICGAVYVLPLALIFAWHTWMLIPIVIGALSGAFLRGCFA